MLSRDELIQFTQDLLNESFGVKFERIIAGNSDFETELASVGSRDLLVEVVKIFDQDLSEHENLELFKGIPEYSELYRPNQIDLIFYRPISKFQDSQIRKAQSLIKPNLQIIPRDSAKMMFDNSTYTKEKWGEFPEISDNIEPGSNPNILEIEQFSVNPLSGQKRGFFIVDYNDNSVEEQAEQSDEGTLLENERDTELKKGSGEVNVGDIVFGIERQVKSDNQLRIIAVGLVTNIHGSGRTIDISWIQLWPSIVTEKPDSDESSFQKIESEFLDNFLKKIIEAQPFIMDTINNLSVSQRLKVERIIEQKLEQDKNFWWINSGDKWSIDNLKIGDIQSYSSEGTAGNYEKFVQSLSRNDLLIGYQSKPAKVKSIVGLFAVTQNNLKEGRYYFELLYKFSVQTKLTELRKLPLFGQSPLSKTLQGSLIKLEADLFEEIINSTELQINRIEAPQPPKDQNAPVDNDGAYTSEDLLDIENDVRSFALLLATQDIKPPIAVALFGRWGSGKSFFMKHLARRVSELSVHQRFLNGQPAENLPKNEDEPFCKGIAQIEFNAWSYLDSNLWAGLISSIFEGLDQYIKASKPGDEEELQIRQTLSNELEVLSTEKKLILDKKEDLENQRDQLVDQIETLKSESEEMVNELAKKELKDLTKSVADELEIDRQLKDQLSDYGIDMARLSHLTPGALHTEATSWYTFIRSFGSLKNRWFLSLFIFCLAVFVFFTIDPFGWVSAFLDNVGKQVIIVSSVALPVFSKWYNSYLKFKKLIQPITDFKNEFNDKLAEAQFEYKRDLEAMQSTLAMKEREIFEKQSQVNHYNKKIEYATHAIDHFVPQKAFNSFIRKRIEQKHYEEHLGLISIIRKDFEVLSNLFTKIEIDEDAPVAVQEDQEKKKELHDKLTDLFGEERMLDRIILYIDDLDRCSDEKVLEVIQAVHLIMAFPLFNVVVGVDKRCVRNALLLKTKLEYLKIAPIKEIEKLGVDMISPGEYLEKIFQIPFDLKEPEGKDVRNLVSNLLAGQIEATTESEVEDEVPEESPSEEKEVANSETEFGIKLVDVLWMHSLGMRQMQQPSLITEAPENLKLTPVEAVQIEQLIPLVGNTPRTIKRFINIYRIIRAYKRPNTEESLTNEDHLAIMFLLAIGIGEHKLFAFEVMRLMGANSNSLLSTIVGKVKGNGDTELELQRFKAAVNNLKEESDLSPLHKLKGKDFEIHIPFVRRFSFGKEEEKTVEETES